MKRPITGPAAAAASAGFATRNFTVVCNAGGASAAGRGRACNTARSRNASNGTGLSGTTRLMIGGGASPTGFIVSPVVMGVIRGPDELKLCRARADMGRNPGDGSPAATRAWLNSPPPCRSVTDAFRSDNVVTPAVMVAMVSAATPKVCRFPIRIGVHVANGSGRLFPESTSVLMGICAL